MLPTSRSRQGHAYKRYLEPAASSESIPRSSKHRLARKGSSVNVSAPTTSARVPADHADIGRSNNTVATLPHSCSASQLTGDGRDSDDDVTIAEAGGDDDEVTSSQKEGEEVEQSPNDDPPRSLPVLDFSIPLNIGGSITKGDALVLIIDFAIKHGLSWCGVEDMLKLANVLIERDGLPESKYLFRRFSGVSPSEMRFNFYCPTCEHFLQETGGTLTERNNISPVCPTCQKIYKGSELTSRGSFFVSLPVEKQLASVLSDDSVKEELLKSLEKNGKPVASASDITEGTMYTKSRRKLKCSKHDLTVTMNADGGSMFNSSNYSIWPVQLIINELPPRLRWSSVLLPLLWYGGKHPNMSLLLQAFAKQMQMLSERGVRWESAGETFHSKVKLILFLWWCNTNCS